MWRLLIAAVLLVSMFVARVEAAETTRKCTEAEADAANRQLWLNKRDKQLALKKHLPWGNPSLSSDEQLLIQRDYVIGYSNSFRIPLWTAYRLSSRGLGKEERVNCFRRDERLHKSVATILADYEEKVFDQGHMAPNGDMSRALNPVLHSFILSNMTPQFCQFNRGVWQIYESIVRLYVKKKKPLGPDGIRRRY